MANIHRNNLTVLGLAHLGVFMDDPYGDGIRLEKIREPSKGRVTALRLIETQNEPLDFEVLDIWNEYGHLLTDPLVWRKDGTLRSWVQRNINFPLGD